MKKPEQPNQTPSAEQKLEIRDEVEKRFGSPPKAFVDLIENEVERRVELRVRGFKMWIGICGAIVAAFIAFIGWFWNNNVHEYIESKLSQQVIDSTLTKATNTLNDILIIKSESELNKEITRLAILSAKSDAGFVSSKVAQIKQEDNVLFKDDFQKFFVIQYITNFDGKKFILDYEPIPHTIRLYCPNAFFEIADLGYFKFDGNTLILTNLGALKEFTNDFASGKTRIEYVRKSIN